jgi:hypothetical protein
MATAMARAIQRANALDRLTKTTKKLAKAHGVDAPEFPLSHRDPAYLPTLQMEAIADFLEALAKSGADSGNEPAETPAPKAAAKKTAKAKGE